MATIMMNSLAYTTSHNAINQRQQSSALASSSRVAQRQQTAARSSRAAGSGRSRDARAFFQSADAAAVALPVPTTTMQGLGMDYTGSSSGMYGWIHLCTVSHAAQETFKSCSSTGADPQRNARYA